MKYSIIVITYQRNDILMKNIVSLQGIKNAEIIVVNDDPAFKLQAKDFPLKNIKVHNNQTNLKLSLSRNKGIELAQGDYLYFIDDDDCVTEQFVEFLNQAQTLPEVAKFQYRFVINGRISLVNRYFPLMKKIHKVDWFTAPSASSYLFKRDLFLKYPQLRFIDCYYEDIIFTWQLIENYSQPIKIFRLFAYEENKDPHIRSITRQEYKLSFLHNTFNQIDQAQIRDKNFLKKVIAIHNLFSHSITKTKQNVKDLKREIRSFKGYFWKLPPYFKFILFLSYFKRKW